MPARPENTVSLLVQRNLLSPLAVFLAFLFATIGGIWLAIANDFGPDAVRSRGHVAELVDAPELEHGALVTVRYAIVRFRADDQRDVEVRWPHAERFKVGDDVPLVYGRESPESASVDSPAARRRGPLGCLAVAATCALWGVSPLLALAFERIRRRQVRP